jgi:hypothetical protein
MNIFDIYENIGVTVDRSKGREELLLTNPWFLKRKKGSLGG